mmetsp:Transcript_25918/g.74933  ORF Transcript_25918/g.74933 Transcript_25918/m.74933 type:complete len:243 (-) Transcript_25918:725-1453(-)
MPSNVILILVARACSTCTSSLVNPFSFQFIVFRLRRNWPDGTVPVPTLLMAWITATTFPNASWTGMHAILFTLFGSIPYAAATSPHVFISLPSFLSRPETFAIIPERAELLSTPSPIGTWAWLSDPSMCLQYKHPPSLRFSRLVCILGEVSVSSSTTRNRPVYSAPINSLASVTMSLNMSSRCSSSLAFSAFSASSNKRGNMPMTHPMISPKAHPNWLVKRTDRSCRWAWLRLGWGMPRRAQ